MTEHLTAPANEIEIKTEPLLAAIGMAPMAAIPRPDLSGLRVKLPNQAPIYLVSPEGYRQWIPNPPTYNNLFRDWNGVVIDIDITQIAETVPLSDGAILARADGTAPVYIVSNGVKRWITAPSVMDKYYFNWNTVVVVPHVLLDFIPTAANWT
jgi:hypothetical protein